MTDQKQILRQEALRHRSRMHQDIEDPSAADDLFFEEIAPQQNQIVAAYYPKDREFDVLGILERLAADGFSCALPIVEKGSRILKFAKWDHDVELKAGAYDIMEPFVQSSDDYVEPDIVIVPLLAFDRRGYRLGYGGGYYDATLAHLRQNKTIIAVGLAYAQQACLFNLPIEDHDEPLDWVITPQEAHDFERLTR